LFPRNPFPDPGEWEELPLNNAALRAAAPLVLALTTATPSRAVLTIDLPNACADRNALQNTAVDAQLNAVRLYYRGLIQNTGEKNRQACLEARVLFDDKFAVINNTRELVVSKCLPVDVAAQMALKDVCP
jgi:hypothetical protein